MQYHPFLFGGLLNPPFFFFFFFTSHKIAIYTATGQGFSVALAARQWEHGRRKCRLKGVLRSIRSSRNGSCVCVIRQIVCKSSFHLKKPQLKDRRVDCLYSGFIPGPLCLRPHIGYLMLPFGEGVPPYATQGARWMA